MHCKPWTKVRRAQGTLQQTQGSIHPGGMQHGHHKIRRLSRPAAAQQPDLEQHRPLQQEVLRLRRYQQHRGSWQANYQKQSCRNIMAHRDLIWTTQAAQIWAMAGLLPCQGAGHWMRILI